MIMIVQFIVHQARIMVQCKKSQKQTSPCFVLIKPLGCQMCCCVNVFGDFLLEEFSLCFILCSAAVRFTSATASRTSWFVLTVQYCHNYRRLIEVVLSHFVVAWAMRPHKSYNYDIQKHWT